MTTHTITAEEQAGLETLHGELLHDAAALTAVGNHNAAAIARARAAFLANLLWGAA